VLSDAIVDVQMLKYDMRTLFPKSGDFYEK